MKVGELRNRIANIPYVSVEGDREVAFALMLDEETYFCQAEVEDGDVLLTCPALERKILDMMEQLRVLEQMRTNYQTALAILQRDAGISERDLFLAEHAVDPVRAISRWRGHSR